MAIRAVLLVALCVAAPVSAQSPYDQVFAEAAALNARNEYAKIVELLQTIPEHAPPRDVVRKHTRIAIALSNLARFSEVPPHIARARQLAGPLNDPAVQASVESAEATFHRQARRIDLAIPGYEKAAELAQKAGDRSMLGRIYGQLSSAYGSMEDWEQAVYFRQKGFDLLENPTALEQFNHVMDNGIAYFELHDRDAAEAQFKEGLALALQSGGKRDESFARGELGYLYWTFDRDAPASVEYLNRAIDLSMEAQTPGLTSTWLLNRGGVWRDTGEFARALADFREVLAIEANFAGRNAFPATKNIAQTYRLMGRLAEAKTMLEALIAEQRSAATPRHLWQAHMELASTYEGLGDRGRADAEYRRMLDVLEEHRNTSILDAFRSGSFAHSLSRYDPYDRYLRFLASGDGAAVRAADALQVAERARARGFLEMLASVRSTIAGALPRELVAEQTRIFRAISDIQRQLRAADLPRARREALLADLSTAEKQRDHFRVRLRIEHPALAEARYPELAAPAGLQSMLRQGETALVFYLSEPASFRWTVTRDRVALDRVAPRTAIESRAERLRALLRTPGDAAPLREEAAALSRLLLENVDVTEHAPLVLVPHGVLHYVPFEVLPVAGRTLIERHPISYAPSMNSLAFLRARDQAAQSFRVLAVGNPSVDRPDAVTAASRGADVDSVAHLGPLPFAAEELGAIRRAFRWSAEILSGREARESALRAEDLRRYPVIHFATHGLVNEKRPARSGLLLSAEAGEDGLLQMSEIYRLGLRADLVVLSACQTALGREVTGEGIVGLTRAFFYAGSRSVIAALWNLNDRFAAEFVAKFYEEIGRGQTAEEALRRVKIAFMRHPQYSHPFYWSSLVLAGDGTRVLYRPLGWTPPVVAALLAALVGFVALTFRRGIRRTRGQILN